MHVLHLVLEFLYIVQDLATHAGTIEDELANGGVRGKVFSEKTAYFFFETPVDRDGNNRQIYDHPVADAELLRLLNQRLAYYLDYRIKDLQDGTVMTFVKAFLVRSKFYMTMSTTEDRVRYTYKNAHATAACCTRAQSASPYRLQRVKRFHPGCPWVSTMALFFFLSSFAGALCSPNDQGRRPSNASARIMPRPE